MARQSRRRPVTARALARPHRPHRPHRPVQREHPRPASRPHRRRVRLS